MLLECIELDPQGCAYAPTKVIRENKFDLEVTVIKRFVKNNICDKLTICCFILKVNVINVPAGEYSMRLSIEITAQQHQHLKAAAALQGQSIKDYVLERTLPAIGEQAALQELEDFLQPRIKAAENGELSSKSVDDIFEEVLQEQNE